VITSVGGKKKNLKTDDINQERFFYTHALALHNIINGLMHSNYNRRVIKMIKKEGEKK